ncbi:MAG: dimethylsulfoniopropionate demethylase, partial [Dinoroseobacter sp.]
VAKDGPIRQVRAIAIEGRTVHCDRVWPIYADGEKVGQVTSASWSPDYGCTVAIGMVRMTHWKPGTKLEVETHEGMVNATVQEKFWL